MTLWIEQYKGCGCSSEASRKKDLLGYCAIHGSDVMARYQLKDGKGAGMKDWDTLSVGEELTKAVSGKMIIKCEVDYSNLIFRFADGSVLRIEYDWIYQWELLNPAGMNGQERHPRGCVCHECQGIRMLSTEE